jgi:hypothetical protein
VPTSKRTQPVSVTVTAEDLLRTAEHHRSRARFHEGMVNVHRQAEAQARALAAAMLPGGGPAQVGDRQEPRGHASPMQDKAVAFLRRTPTAGYAELTAHLYGETSMATLNRARVLVLKLRENKAITGLPGRWKVLRPDKGGGAV